MAYTTIDDPSAHCQAVIWTGNATDDRAINIGMQPDLVWWKHRTSASYWHYIVDSSRGIGNQLYTNGADAEGTHSGGHVKSYTSTGITIDDDQAINHGSTTYASWMWKANGGTRTTFSESGANPAGGYQANTTAGFSIVDYTGTGSSGGTLAHGLGAVPKMFMVKSRSIGDSWTVYHAHNTSAPETDMLKLDENVATSDNVVFWNDTAPTSTVFTVDGGNGEPKVNQDSATYIAYVWTEIKGYSKFGTYRGNNSADGQFVYTGFSPAIIMIKRTDSSGSWVINDSTRNTYNQANNTLVPNEAWVESTNDYYAIDILSNGFKIRNNNPETGGSGTTNVYAAWAEHPFVSSEGVPCTAR